MARFGRFESVRELHRTGLTVVYSAQEVGTPGERFALKVFDPPLFALEEDQIRSESVHYLDSARIQQKVASGKAEHWAPVYECGSAGNGGFYATDRYDRSLQQLIDGRIRLSSPVLHAIIESIVKGIVELKEECGRPHGNLKATNVLFAGAGDVTQTKIALSDPSPQEHIDSKAHWNRDLRAVAEFIYELIIHRPTPVVDGWQVPDSKEWSKLGRHAEAWRDLCNLLLSASGESGTVTIETAVEKLEKIKEATSSLSTRRRIAAGIVLIACIAVLVLLVRRPPPPPEKAEWESLCNTYQAWVDDLRQRSNEKGIRDRWSRDAKLAETLQSIEIASYPDKVMRDEAKLYIREIIEHPEYAEQRKTQEALAAIEQIRRIFDPNSTDAWPFLSEIADAEDKFRDLGWQPAATYLGDFVERARPEPNKPIVEHVDMILEFSQRGVLKSIELCLQNALKYEKVIGSLEDPILAQLDYAYVTRQVAEVADVNALSDRLSEFVNLSRTIAEFIERDWQSNVDQEAFSVDHGNDSAENPTERTFRERLDLIKEYYYLRPDPREAIFSLVSNIEQYTKEALISNPSEARACVEGLDGLRPTILSIQAIRPIARNEQDIQQTINQYKPQLDELLDRADRARELPRDYIQRLQEETVSTAQADELNETWIRLRDKLLAAYPLSVLEQNLESYAELRRNMDQTYSNLVVLDRELETQLPLQTGIAAGERGWKQELAQVYVLGRNDKISRIVERIPLKNGTPDANDATFKDFRTAQFSEFAQWRADLAGLIMAFDTIEDTLGLCHLLDDNVAQGGRTVRSVWQEWKDTGILEDSSIRKAVAGLIARIARLEQIEQSSDPQELVPIALDTNSESEAAYAAWTRLDQMPNLLWPDQYEDLTQDRGIRDRLRNDFETIGGRNETRANHLFAVLAGTGLKHEIKFVERNRFEDKVLGRLVQYATEMNCSDSRSECDRMESAAKDIADFLAGEDWQTDKIEKALFSDESSVHNSGTAVTTETFGQWLTEVRGYRKLESDPRNDSQYSWDNAISKIDTEIRNELGRKPEGDYLTKLQGLRSDFDDAMGRISNMRQLPLIEKHRGEIAKSRDYWQELRGIERKLKPEYCGRLDVDNGRLIFAANALGPNFEPVDAEKKNPVLLPAGWEPIREAVKNRQREWLDFFYTIDGNDVSNMGWPRHIRSTKDPTVILTFIPAGPGNSEPFYMATHEITNRQYRLFLERFGAIRGNPKLPGWSIVTDQANNKLIQCTVTNTPPSAIQWDKSGGNFGVAEAEADLPVTWVTFYGAQAYCQWFAGQLPSALQHEYACTAETGDVRPWGDNTSEIGSYAHVRGPVWQNAANQWNRNKDSKVPPLPVEPIGAIEDYKDRDNRIIDPNAIVVASDISNSVWPVAAAAKANAWGLHDMIGNVWEWCQDSSSDTQPVICGGSCVAPPKFILLESRSDYAVGFNDRANDVGFRAIVLAK